MLAKFGKSFTDYIEKTPRFIPDFKLMRDPDSYILNVKVYKKSLLDATMFIWLCILLQFIERLQHLGVLPVIFSDTLATVD